MDSQATNEVDDQLQRSFRNFIEAVPANRLSKNIRRLLLVYLRCQSDIGTENYFQELINDLEIFFDFLDDVEDECNKEIDKS